MPRGGKQPGAGRPPGRKNQATIERERAAALTLERDALIQELKAKEAAEGVITARTAGIKLAKEVLEDFMRLFAGQAARYQPLPQGMDPATLGVTPDENKFKEWAVLAVDVAKDLAPYQSPKLSAVMVGGAVVQQIEMIGGIPDYEDGGFEDAPSDARTIELEPIVIGADGVGIIGAGTDQGAGGDAVPPSGPTGAPPG